MTEVTAIITVLNEEEHIRDCLETLNWCDKILVVDNGSEDDTVEIAREYTDNIIHYQKQHGISEPLKRHGKQQVDTEWAFLIDADELVPPKLADELETIVEHNQVDVVEIPFKNYLFGKWIKATKFWPVFHQRLFRTDSMTLTDDIHTHKSVDPDATIHRLSPDPERAIIHFNYTDIADYVSRTNRYTTIEAEYKENTFHYINLIKRPVEEFGYQLFKTKGYKIGRYGVLIAVLTAWYQILLQLKMWERRVIGTSDDHQKRYDEIRDDVLKDWQRN